MIHANCWSYRFTLKTSYGAFIETWFNNSDKAIKVTLSFDTLKLNAVIIKITIVPFKTRKL